MGHPPDESIASMWKVSSTDGLAIGGGILAIMLIVMDKAGKLKGPMLFVLLAFAACMALPLCFSASWVTRENASIAIFARRMLMVFAVGLIYAALCVWITTGNDDLAGTFCEGSARANTISRPPPLTLHYLFKHDFDSTVRMSRPFSFTENATGKTIEFETQVYLDLPARAKFLGVYFPFTTSEDTLKKCEVLLEVYQAILNQPSDVSGGSVGEEMMSSKDLRQYHSHCNVPKRSLNQA